MILIVETHDACVTPRPKGKLVHLYRRASPHQSVVGTRWFETLVLAARASVATNSHIINEFRNFQVQIPLSALLYSGGGAPGHTEVTLLARTLSAQPRCAHDMGVPGNALRGRLLVNGVPAICFTIE